MRCILFQQSFQQLQFDFLKALVFRNKQDIIENEKSKKVPILEPWLVRNRWEPLGFGFENRRVLGYLMP